MRSVLRRLSKWLPISKSFCWTKNTPLQITKGTYSRYLQKQWYHREYQTAQYAELLEAQRGSQESSPVCWPSSHSFLFTSSICATGTAISTAKQTLSSPSPVILCSTQHLLFPQGRHFPTQATPSHDIGQVMSMPLWGSLPKYSVFGLPYHTQVFSLLTVNFLIRKWPDPTHCHIHLPDMPLFPFLPQGSLQLLLILPIKKVGLGSEQCEYS